MRPIAFIAVLFGVMALVLGLTLGNSEILKVHTGPELARRYGVETDAMREQARLEAQRQQALDAEMLRNLAQTNRNNEQIQLREREAAADIQVIIAGILGLVVAIAIAAGIIVVAYQLTAGNRLALAEAAVPQRLQAALRADAARAAAVMHQEHLARIDALKAQISAPLQTVPARSSPAPARETVLSFDAKPRETRMPTSPVQMVFVESESRL